jgi:uncharacterized protein
MHGDSTWIQTYTGGQFWPLDPRAADVCAEDIAHALSLVCRYGGHCKAHFSVAQHSVLVAELCPHHQLQGLLHDAAEAYLGDQVQSLKQELHLGSCSFADAERRLLRCIGGAFGCSLDPLPAEVHRADRAAMLCEKRCLMAASWPWKERAGDSELPRVRIEPWTPVYAEERWLQELRRALKS